MICLLLVYGQTAWRNYVRDVAVPLGICAALGGKCVRVALCHWGARNRLVYTRRVAGERDDMWYHAICLLLVCGQTVWRHDVRDVTVPFGFARPWWKVRLRGAVPLGSAKQAGVHAARRW